MHIPRHWRLNSQRYALQGVTCPHCAANIFPPREYCPYCESRTDEAKPFESRALRGVATTVEFVRAAR